MVNLLCVDPRKPSYDLRQGTFREGWDVFLKSVREQESSPGFGCGGCELRMVCAQCPAVGMYEFGNPEARSPFLCKIAHLRQAAFDPAFAQ